MAGQHAQVLFIQGAGEDVHDRWDDKLVASLERALGSGYTVSYPRMPQEAEPKHAAWKAALRSELERLSDGAILVAHSVGATTALHALAEGAPKKRLGGIFLVAAPFIGEGGWPSDEVEPRTDFGARLPSEVPVFLYHGTNDEVAQLDHVRLYEKTLPRATIRILEGRDHQLNEDMSEVARDIRSLERS